MAKQINTKKGFAILRMTHQEAVNTWYDFGGLGICDHCLDKALSGGYYIPVLAMYYCPRCYRSWYRRAKYYPEDRSFENKKLKETLTIMEYQKFRYAPIT